MEVMVSPGWITAVLLATIRLTPIFVMTPVFGSVKLPPQFRILLIVALSAWMVSAAKLSAIHIPVTLGDLFLAGVTELLIGGLLSFGLIAGFSAFLLAGRLIEMQIGLGLAAIIDPTTRSQMPVLGNALQLMAVFIFFAIDGHHMILRGLAFSFEALPLGSALPEIRVEALAAQFGSLFTFGVALIIPVIMVLFLLDIALGVVSRTMPQVNVFIISIPLKVFIGFSVLAITVPHMGPVINRIFISIFVFWESVLTHG